MMDRLPVYEWYIPQVNDLFSQGVFEEANHRILKQAVGFKGVKEFNSLLLWGMTRDFHGPTLALLRKKIESSPLEVLPDEPLLVMFEMIEDTDSIEYELESLKRQIAKELNQDTEPLVELLRIYSETIRLKSPDGLSFTEEGLKLSFAIMDFLSSPQWENRITQFFPYSVSCFTNPVNAETKWKIYEIARQTSYYFLSGQERSKILPMFKANLLMSKGLKEVIIYVKEYTEEIRDRFNLVKMLSNHKPITYEELQIGLKEMGISEGELIKRLMSDKEFVNFFHRNFPENSIKLTR